MTIADERLTTINNYVVNRIACVYKCTKFCTLQTNETMIKNTTTNRFHDFAIVSSEIFYSTHAQKNKVYLFYTLKVLKNASEKSEKCVVLL